MESQEGDLSRLVGQTLELNASEPFVDEQSRPEIPAYLLLSFRLHPGRDEMPMSLVAKAEYRKNLILSATERYPLCRNLSYPVH